MQLMLTARHKRHCGCKKEPNVWSRYRPCKAKLRSVLHTKRKATEKKVRLDSLPKHKQPAQLLPLAKMFADMVKMIAYRAETAMVSLDQATLEQGGGTGTGACIVYLKWRH